MKEYNYINDIGYHKKLVVEKLDDNRFHVQLWSMDTGDFCGSGDMTQEELNDFFQHYGIQG